MKFDGVEYLMIERKPPIPFERAWLKRPVLAVLLCAASGVGFVIGWHQWPGDGQLLGLMGIACLASLSWAVLSLVNLAKALQPICGSCNQPYRTRTTRVDLLPDSFIETRTCMCPRCKIAFIDRTRNGQKPRSSLTGLT